MRLSRLAVACALGVLAVPRLAEAQLHWDASLQGGVMKRFLASQPAGARDAGFGPFVELEGHVALLPLVRVGGYLGTEISPRGGDPSARNITWGGLRAKVMSPWPRGDLRLWLFLGFGIAGVYEPSYRTAAPANTLMGGAGGHFFEVPLGIGVSYKLRKPLELCAELGKRIGFADSGSTYDGAGSTGKDRFAIGLSLGVLVDL